MEKIVPEMLALCLGDMDISVFEIKSCGSALRRLNNTFYERLAPMWANLRSDVRTSSELNVNAFRARAEKGGHVTVAESSHSYGHVSSH